MSASLSFLAANRTSSRTNASSEPGPYRMNDSDASSKSYSNSYASPYPRRSFSKNAAKRRSAASASRAAARRRSRTRARRSSRSPRRPPRPRPSPYPRFSNAGNASARRRSRSHSGSAHQSIRNRNLLGCAAGRSRARRYFRFRRSYHLNNGSRARFTSFTPTSSSFLSSLPRTYSDASTHSGHRWTRYRLR